MTWIDEDEDEGHSMVKSVSRRALHNHPSRGQDDMDSDFIVCRFYALVLHLLIEIIL